MKVGLIYFLVLSIIRSSVCSDVEQGNGKQLGEMISSHDEVNGAKMENNNTEFVEQTAAKYTGELVEELEKGTTNEGMNITHGVASATKRKTPESQPIRFYDYNTEKYPNTEHLEIKPLEGNNLLFSFNFESNGTTKLYPEEKEIVFYDVFPKALGNVLRTTQTRELHLRFGSGWYDSEFNGKLVNNGFLSGGTGVELWATIESGSKEEAFEQWIHLANSLSGMFCASFNFIDSSITTTPANIFKNEIDLNSQAELKGNLYTFRSALPREPICTENLTPFLKMLSTKGKQGISSLLSGSKLFNADWNSMSVDVLTDCTGGNGNECQLIMKQAINMILNVPKILERNEMPIPKPTPGSEMRCDKTKIFDAYNCFPLPPTKEQHYSLVDLFGKTIKGGSLIASNPTTVCLDVDLNNWEIEVLTLSSIKQFEKDDKLCFLLDSSAEYNIKFNTPDSSKIKKLEKPPFYASRSLSGSSQDSGGFRLDLYNPEEQSKHIHIFQTLPWFVRLYLHSLTVTITNDDGTKILNVHDPQLSEYIREIIYNPAIDRIAPTHLELHVDCPPQSKLKFAFNFDKAMLLYSEYPPDANHGFELEPTVFALLNDDSNVEYIMRTTTALLTLPTPDFSMPYNVIIITLTVLAMAFGSLFNMLVKKTITEAEAENSNTQRPLERLKRKFGSLFGGSK